MMKYKARYHIRSSSFLKCSSEKTMPQSVENKGNFEIFTIRL